MSDLLIFFKWITLMLFRFKKTSNLQDKIWCIHHVFDSFSLLFPFLCPRGNCSHCSSLPSLFLKERQQWFAVALFPSLKTSDSHKSPKSKFPTLILAQISAQFFFLSSFPNVYCEFCGNVSLTEIKFIVIKVIVTTTTNTTNISLIIFLFWKEILSSLFHTCI